VKRLAVFVVLVVTATMLGGCAGTDRPEGVVERWLIALNQGAAGRPAQYAPDALSQRVLPGWASKDPGELDVIEVGNGRSLETGCILNPTCTQPPGIRTALVPYRVVRLDGTTIEGSAILVELTGGWRVATLRGKTDGLAVPSEGGQRIGSGGVALWLAALGTAALCSLLAIGLMAAFGRAQPTPAAA
jgi:hypothetical protein